MKLFTFITLLLTALSSQAVVTSHCPEIIQTELSSYKSFGKDSVSSTVLEGTLELQRAENSVCHYKNVLNEGDITKARLEGSVKEGAKNPATLIVFYKLGQSEFASYMDVDFMSSDEISISKKATVHLVSEICSHGCIKTHRAIGNAEFNFAADF